jgi:hypothetical protein
MTDAWRAFALATAQECKKSASISTEHLSQRVLECAEKEATVLASIPLALHSKPKLRQPSVARAGRYKSL